MRLISGTGTARSLGREKYWPAAFQLKNNKCIVKILKRLHDPFNYTNIHIKIPKYPQMQSFFFVFSEAKSVI